MLKKILKYTIVIALLCYAVFALVLIPMRNNSNRCKEVIVYIEGDKMGAMSREIVMEMLDKEGLNPLDIHVDSIVCSRIEKQLGALSLVKECQVYMSTKGYLNIELDCKLPVIKVVENNGRTYYVDCEGDIIEGIQKALYLPVATGCVTDSMANTELKEIANAINGDTFWTAQIEQFHFDKDGNVVIVPRVGDHIIEIGKAENVEEKLKKLHTFYHKGINTIGWNKYSKLNIEFNGKVICTKR